VLSRADPATTLVVNADDPVLVAVARQHRGPVRYFGIDGGPSRPGLEDWADVRRCPICESRLVYQRVTFAHLGHYRCSAGDLERPEASVRATAVRPQGLAGLELRLEVGGWERSTRVPLPGLYNAYNVVAALAAAQAVGVAPATALHAVARAGPAFGRAETIPTPQAELVLLLVKNPAGANQTLGMLAGEPEPLDTLALLNDGIADGQDVSWIWDVDFEHLRTRRLTVGGRRAHDLALRLKYAGATPAVGETQVVPGIAGPLDAALATASGRLAVLTTYTAMLDLRAECARRGWTSPYWSAGP
jgi:UDP-N-acetylmuramyl tripeptide synthase